MSKRRHPEAHRVEVEWVDSSYHTARAGWQAHDEVIAERRRVVRCLSVGLLIADDKHGVTLASSAHGNDLAGTMSIPRGAITKVRILWKASS
jgi:hypothetical protein